MNKLPVVDVCIIGLYFMAMIGVGIWFSFQDQRVDQFTKALRIPFRKIPNQTESRL